MNLINELRMLAEDLYSAGGHNRYASALSKAADELASLERYHTAYNEWIDKTEWVQADTTLPAKYLGMHRADVLKDMISELFNRLEAAESARRDDYQNWMTALDRNAELLAKLEAAEKERDAAELMSLALQAKVEQMEKQEPVAWMLNCPTLGGDTGWILSWTQSGAGLCNRLSGEENEKRLYALPCAQNMPEKLCYDSRWEISIDYVDGWNAAIDAVRGKSPSWYCPNCCIVFPFGEPKSCPHDDAQCNRALTAAPEVEGK